MDTERLHTDIQSHLRDDPVSTECLNTHEHGPEPRTVYFGMQDAYTSLTRAIFDYMFSNTCMIIPLQATTAR